MEMELDRKLEILADAAKYDVACTSSGVDRAAKLGQLGSASAAGICHSFSADGRCITLLKVLMTNICKYDCAYCANRRSNDIPRTAFTPRELADITIEFYRRNYIEGLFLSSGVFGSPDFTMEKMLECVQILRNEYGFLGYIHIKAIPGTSQELLDRIGFLTDRMSVNIELPSNDSLSIIAPDKNRDEILSPMAHMARQISENKGRARHRLTGSERSGSAKRARAGQAGSNLPVKAMGKQIEESRFEYDGRYTPAGQSTQLIIGASPESDYQILRLSDALYRSYALKRVFFSAYMPINETSILPGKETETPLRREHRLYQADWLMRFYGFGFEEIIDAQDPFLDLRLDPKCDWAIRNIDLFPLEVNTAPYEMLLRVPGLGVVGAQKIARARRQGKVTFDDFPKMGLSLKKARYFITCNGKFSSPAGLDAERIRAELVAQAAMTGKRNRTGGKRQSPGQLSLLDLPDSPLASMHGEEALASSKATFQKGQLTAFANQKLLLESLHAKEERHALAV